MLPVSNAFKRAILQSHTIATRAELYLPKRVDDHRMKYVFAGEVQVLSGSVTVDETAQFRRSFTGLQVIVPYPSEKTAPRTPGPGLNPVLDDWTQYIPTSASSNFAPHGSELKLWRGVWIGPATDYPDGSVMPGDHIEWVPLGIFSISCSDVNYTGNGLLLTLDGYDHSRKISRATLSKSQLYYAGKSVADIVTTMIGRQVGTGIAIGGFLDMANDFSITGQNNFTKNLPPIYYLINDDPWAEATSLVTVTGSEIFINAYGKVVIRPLFSPSHKVTPVATYAAAEDQEFDQLSDNVLLSIDPKWDDQYVVNTWIVEGGGPSVDRFVGIARDTKSASPTNVFVYGEVAMRIQSSLVSTPQMAFTMAKGLLSMHSGIVNSIQFGNICNPALEPGDPIKITYPRAGASGIHYIQSLTIPMDAGTAMTGTTREIASL